MKRITGFCALTLGLWDCSRIDIFYAAPFFILLTKLHHIDNSTKQNIDWNVHTNVCVCRWDAEAGAWDEVTEPGRPMCRSVDSGDRRACSGHCRWSASTTLPGWLEREVRNHTHTHTHICRGVMVHIFEPKMSVWVVQFGEHVYQTNLELF